MNDNFKIGDKVRNIISETIGTIVGFYDPAKFGAYPRVKVLIAVNSGGETMMLPTLWNRSLITHA